MNTKDREELFSHLEDMLESLQYGTITVIIQDGKIVQLEKNEKLRIQSQTNRIR